VKSKTSFYYGDDYIMALTPCHFNFSKLTVLESLFGMIELMDDITCSLTPYEQNCSAISYKSLMGQGEPD
jgi:hypothetical protein